MKKLWNWFRDTPSRRGFVCDISYGPVRLGIVVNGVMKRKAERTIHVGTKLIGRALSLIMATDPENGVTVMFDVVMGLFCATFGPLAEDDEQLDKFLAKARGAMIEAREAAGLKKDGALSFLDTPRDKPSHTVH